MSDWVNHQALEWAWHCDKVQSSAERVTLVSYAKHCDEKGYSGVSVRNIASTWKLHHITVSLARDRLIAARLLHETKKKRGQTRQTKVYRLPKIAWGSGLRIAASKKTKRSQSGHKAVTKRSDGDHEQLITDKEQRKYHDQEKIFSSNYQNQNQPAQSHVKWPEFAVYCRSKHGAPSENGFWSWLCKQKPQWRNKIQQKFDGEEGYVLDGKFFTPEEANRMAENDSQLTLKFRRAIKRDDKIQIA